MTINFLKSADGSGRELRQVQVDALTWLQDNWGKSKYHVIQAPVGSGKSLLARSIQRQTSGQIIVPSNLLMRQYLEGYHDVNFLMGKTHYKCQSGLSCKDWIDVLEQKACDSCPYYQCKAEALEGRPSFFNPMSLYYLTRAEGYQKPDTVIVDEAHELSSLILLLCGVKLRRSEYGFSNKVVNEIYLIEWLKETLRKLYKIQSQYQKTGDSNKVADVTDRIENIALTSKGMEEDAQNYAIWIEEGTHRGRKEEFLNIKPIRPPKFLVNRILDAKHIVLLSGTISHSDISDLLGDIEYGYLDLPSPIPKENRAIFYRPAAFDINFKTPPEKIAGEINKVLKANPGVNTIIHTTYDMSKKLFEFLPKNTLMNKEDNKDAILEEFKRSGGILLASGMAEGIDLPGDLCRLNIIPKLLYPNLRDPVVIKRKAMGDGQEWYVIKTLMKAVQQAGRSTRGVTDYSKTYVLDPQFGRLVRQYGEKLPKSFTEAIVWAAES